MYGKTSAKSAWFASLKESESRFLAKPSTK